MINPFQNQNKNEEKQLNEARDYETRNNVISSAVSTGNMNEDMAWEERREKLAELTKWQQDLDQDYQELFFDLSGLQPNDSGDLVPTKDYSAPCNYNGSKMLVNYVKRVNKNVMMGAWDSQAMRRELLNRGDNLVFELALNNNLYGIGKEHINYVFEVVFSTIVPTFMRGKENGERNFQGKIQKQIETKNIMPEKEKRGLFSR